MAIVLPNLGGPGFWDPDELKAVTEIGRGELAARIGPALLGLLSVALVAATAWRLAGRRAAALAAIAMSTCPLFVLNARLATSSMQAIAGAAAIGLATAGLVRRRSWVSAIDALIAAAGVALLASTIAGYDLELGTQRAGFAWAAGIETAVYGLFPWIAIAPAFAATRRARPVQIALAVSAVVFCAATVANITVAIVLPPMAVAAGIALDRPRGRAPIAAVAALSLSVLLGRDLMRFPGKLAELGTGVSRELSVDSVTATLPMVFGIAFGIAAAIALSRPRRTFAVFAVLGCFGLALSHVWIPRVSKRHSQKHLFSLWRDVRGDPEAPIWLWRVPVRAAREYATDAYRVAARASELGDMLRRPDSFAIVPGSGLCTVRAAAVAAGADLRVLEGGWDTFSLVAGSLPHGRSDRGPLAGVIERGGAGAEPVVSLADGIEILEVRMPDRVSRGSRFEMVMRYRVTKRPRRAWRVFVHFDGPGLKFQGDHHPIDKKCPTTQWMPGDVVTDRFTVKAGNVAYPRGRYLVWVGFFVGSHGNWTNQEVVTGDRDGNNRAHVGSILVD